MAIRRKPQETAAVAADDRRIDELIEKGGSVATAERPARETGKPALVQLRLDPDLVQRIDSARKKRTVPPSRHAWMLEAIIDKLQADA